MKTSRPKIEGLQPPSQDTGVGMHVMTLHSAKIMSAELQRAQAVLRCCAAARGCDPAKWKGGHR